MQADPDDPAGSIDSPGPASDGCGPGGMDRRRFLYLTVAAALTGCQAPGSGALSSPALGNTHVVDAGPAGKYAADGVYSAYRDQGFFIVRRDGRLFALSSYCTHRKCKLNAEADHTFYCPCHGSTFDPGGKVTDGPATRDLPMLDTSGSPETRLLVKVPVA